MFSYRPPKSSCWGHAIQASDLDQARQKLHTFFDTFFEPSDRQERADAWDFNWLLKWKNTILPNIVWPEMFLTPGNENSQRSLFLVTLGGGSRISFPMGITFPISPTEPASYEFLGRFSAAAPFKMSPRHFQVGILRGKKGKLAWRKPDAETAARLLEVI